jgi:electron transport complex protein RnfB
MITAILLLVLVLLPPAVGVLFILDRGQAEELSRNRMLADRIDALLPQTQCGACGYPDCRSYANAIVSGAAGIHHCPPGGMHTRNRLAELLSGSPVSPSAQQPPEEPNLVARIDEQLCIGCVKCISACPVDAIIGAARQMHTVMPKVCTGCGLCLPPCPVDCITLVPEEARIKRFVWPKPQSAVEVHS